jgi:hypothetical protein
MSVLPEPPTTQAILPKNQSPEHAAFVHLEPRFVPATESQLLIIGTALRLLAVWAVRAAGPASDAASST